MKPLDRVRKICLAFPEATEKVSWGAPTYRVRDKQFAIYLDNHHGDGRLALWCKAADGAQEILVESDPGRFFVPPYVGCRGWVGIELDKGLDWGVIEGLLREGYLEIAPKRLKDQLTGAKPTPRARPARAGRR